MGSTIRKVAVLGAGVMGSGIAAHCAGAGLQVLLLDIVPPKPNPGDDVGARSFRNRFAAGAKENLRKQRPSPIFHPGVLDAIEVGNFDDDLAKIADCDWVVEVVKEDLALKQALFAKVEKFLAPHAIVSSNTSGLSIVGMTDGRGKTFRQNFLVTHFFNPVRYMKLLELVAGPETDPKVVAAFHKFGEETLGKGIVYGKDTTNFIANRIGIYGIMKTIAEMQKAELSVEEVDKIFGPAMGRPKSAIFRTADIVGLDTFLHVAKNCFDTLPKDEACAIFEAPKFLTDMVGKGWLGDKSGQGFYKKEKGGGGEKSILSLDLKTLEYKAQAKVRFDSLGMAKGIEDVKERVAAVMKADDKAGKFAEKVTLDVIAYASRRIPEIADDLVNVDRGMRWGFAWDLGPFECWDAYGVEAGLARMKELGIEPAPWVVEMVGKGRKSFYAVEGGKDTYWDIPSKSSKVVPENAKIAKVEYLRRGNKEIVKNDSATLWDMGDGVLLCEFHSKMNSVDQDNTAMIHAAVDRAQKDFRAIVVGNDGANFSAGANIGALMMAIGSEEFEAIRKLVKEFQSANQRLRYSSIPVVTAPFGLTLGGGAELAMAGNAIQASAETYMGLVEFGVGLIPGGSGSLELMRNVYGPFSADPGFDFFPFLKKIFLTIGTAKVATSAEEAREIGFLSPTDGVSFNRDFLLADAKAKAIGLAESGFRAPRPSKFRLPGRSGAATIDMMLYDMMGNGQISAHDRKVGMKLAGVLTGGDTVPGALVTEEKLLELECEAFLSLCGEPLTQARIMYMLEKGKPLRN